MSNCLQQVYRLSCWVVHCSSHTSLHCWCSVITQDEIHWTSSLAIWQDKNLLHLIDFNIFLFLLETFWSKYLKKYRTQSTKLISLQWSQQPHARVITEGLLQVIRGHVSFQLTIKYKVGQNRPFYTFIPPVCGNVARHSICENVPLFIRSKLVFWMSPYLNMCINSEKQHHTKTTNLLI